MIRRILIANRGEIALRIMRACRMLGLTSVFVYPPDVDARLECYSADEAYCSQGTLNPNDLYLNGEYILELCRTYAIDAVHPGYGFLAEHAGFAEECKQAGIIFIGASAATLVQTGDKVQAKSIATSLSIPTLLSSKVLPSKEVLYNELKHFPLPALLKATNGGGGKGIGVIRTVKEAMEMYEKCFQQANAFFGIGDLYLEKSIQKVKHIEIQIARDVTGKTVYFPERDCSVQRHHQKLIEESPAPSLHPSLHTILAQASSVLVEAVQLVGVATVEFLVRGKEYYFLEINPRIQVEHGVTEEVTGVDLVQLQILIACGQPIAIEQEDIKVLKHVIQCRILAEDPTDNFSPSYGTLTQYKAPGGFGVRVDDGVYPGMQIQPYFDSLLAKLITFGDTREEALLRMRGALKEYLIQGVDTTVALLREIIDHPEFFSGSHTTSFIDLHDWSLQPPDMMDMSLSKPHSEEVLIAEVVAEVYRQQTLNISAPKPLSQWKTLEGF